jgi:8-oxo-dGTP pyrophosphatase MutT (NUDIX family)
VNSEIRKAASVIAVRDGASGPEVLVLERATASRFLPGYIVFPGGAVDAEDVQLASRWFASDEEAARAGAVRELAEEAGLVLTADGLVPASGDTPLSLAMASPPAATQLHEVAHWVAPETVPVRFDARYFAVAASHGLEPVADGLEAAVAWWTSPLELLHGWEAGKHKLYWPTYFTMNRLADCADAVEVLALRFTTREASDDEATHLPRSVFWQD